MHNRSNLLLDIHVTVCHVCGHEEPGVWDYCTNCKNQYVYPLSYTEEEPAELESRTACSGPVYSVIPHQDDQGKMYFLNWHWPESED